MLYLIALFLHVAGALILAAAVAVEWQCVTSMRKAVNLENVRDSLSTYSKVSMIGETALALILIPGIYMAAVAWRSAGWVAIGFLGVILIGAIGGTMTGRKMRQMRKEAGSLDSITPGLRKRTLDNSFVLSIRMRTMILLGIVYMMTVKPPLAGSFVALVVSVVLGFLPIGPRTGREVSDNAGRELEEVSK